MEALERAIIALDEFEKANGRSPSRESGVPFEMFLAGIIDIIALLVHPHVEVPPGAVEHMDRLVRGFESHEMRRDGTEDR